MTRLLIIFRFAKENRIKMNIKRIDIGKITLRRKEKKEETIRDMDDLLNIMMTERIIYETDLKTFFDDEDIKYINKVQNHLSSVMRNSKQQLIDLENFLEKNKEYVMEILREREDIPQKLQDVITKYYNQNIHKKMIDPH